jgi:hypothetical protein
VIHIVIDMTSKLANTTDEIQISDSTRRPLYQYSKPHIIYEKNNKYEFFFTFDITQYHFNVGTELKVLFVKFLLREQTAKSRAQGGRAPTKLLFEKSFIVPKLLTPNENCSICLDAINISDAHITQCQHIFHSKCINKYASVAGWH